MSKSSPNTAIFMTDSAEDVDRKIRNAYCPEKQVPENPILEYCRYIIFQRMKFCDIWAGESHNILWRMKKAGIPILVLDREYQVSASGQVQTRVQAFLESMGK